MVEATPGPPTLPILYHLPWWGGLTTWRLGAWDGGTEWAGWQAWRADMDSVSLPGRVGEGRACWSLGNAYVSMGSPAQALTFAKKHLEISQEVSRACPALSPQACPSPVLEPSPGPSWRCLQTSGPCASVCPELFPGGHHLCEGAPPLRDFKGLVAPPFLQPDGREGAAGAHSHPSKCQCCLWKAILRCVGPCQSCSRLGLGMPAPNA